MKDPPKRELETPSIGLMNRRVVIGASNKVLHRDRRDWGGGNKLQGRGGVGPTC